MSDIVERLRDHLICATGHECVLCTAAGEIKRLERAYKDHNTYFQKAEDRIEKLEDALGDIRRRCEEYGLINVHGPKKAGTIRNCLLIADAALK